MSAVGRIRLARRLSPREQLACVCRPTRRLTAPSDRGRAGVPAPRSEILALQRDADADVADACLRIRAFLRTAFAFTRHLSRRTRFRGRWGQE
jgi:hypothetical protein